MKQLLSKLRWYLACFIMTKDQFEIMDKALSKNLAQCETRQKMYHALCSLFHERETFH